MDKVTKQIENMLFDVFGLCPDYKIQWIEGEWIEYYHPRYPYWVQSIDPCIYPEKVRVLLNEHRTMLESGLVVSAYFAVDHSSHTIFLRILKMSGGDSFGKVYTKDG